MKKILILLALTITSFFILSTIESKANSYEPIDIVYYSHGGILLGYYTLTTYEDIDNFNYGYHKPQETGTNFQYARTGYTFIGWEDRTNNIIFEKDDEYIVNTDKQTVFYAYFELTTSGGGSGGNYIPTEPMSIGTITYASPQSVNGVIMREITFSLTMPESITTPTNLIFKLNHQYQQYVKNVRVWNPNTAHSFINHAIYINETSSMDIIIIKNITTFTNNVLFVSLTILESFADMHLIPPDMFNDAEIYDISFTEYVMDQIGSSQEDIDQAYDDGFYAGYMTLLNNMDSQIQQAEEQGYHAGFSNALDYYHENGFGSIDNTSKSYRNGYDHAEYQPEAERSILTAAGAVLGLGGSFLIFFNNNISLFGITIFGLIMTAVIIAAAIWFIREIL